MFRPPLEETGWKAYGLWRVLLSITEEDCLVETFLINSLFERTKKGGKGHGKFHPLWRTVLPRAPTPDRTDWEKRPEKTLLRKGLIPLKSGAQWRWNNPSEEAYDFSDLDVLMDLAQENKLKVVINTIF